MDDTSVFKRKTPQCQRPRVDRFVMPRDSIVEMNMRLSGGAGRTAHTVDIWHAKRQQQDKYKIYLDKALGLEPLKYHECAGNYVQSWPCAPRRRGYLTSLDSILDLPSYSYAPFPELVDWSTSNYLVAALGRDYHMFSWLSQGVIGRGGTMHQIECCKFDPRGELLLVGTNMSSIEIHNNIWCFWTADGRCPCRAIEGACSITASDWSPTGNSFVTGCSRGLVSAFDRTGALLHSWRAFPRGPILAVRISPDTRYVAFVMSITWHPWRSALLGVGAVSYDNEITIGVWDVPSSKCRKTTLQPNNYTLDVMLFSHRTGELVLSLWNLDRSSQYLQSYSQLVVLSDPHTVVDRSEVGRSGVDRVRTMVFSPDGTKLATATGDEDLIIWNFLPEDKKKKKTVKSRRFSAIPVYLEEITNGFVLR